jgi:hypothetical protein
MPTPPAPGPERSYLPAIDPETITILISIADLLRNGKMSPARAAKELQMLAHARSQGTPTFDL